MEHGIPLLGEAFPAMTVKTTHGMMELPKAYSGKWFVLFSHPADFTPVCTTEFAGFQKLYPQFRELGCELIGLSIDQVFSHIKWIDWIDEKLDIQIEFPVIADDMGSVARALGMVHPGKGTNTVRAVFVVDPKGIMRLMLYYPQEVGRNMEEVLRAVKALQISDGKGVAMPANWPKNDLIGENVILPPATSQKDAEARKGQKDCYDWWFCHKKLD